MWMWWSCLVVDHIPGYNIRSEKWEICLYVWSYHQTTGIQRSDCWITVWMQVLISSPALITVNSTWTVSFLPAHLSNVDKLRWFESFNSAKQRRSLCGLASRHETDTYPQLMVSPPDCVPVISSRFFTETWGWWGQRWEQCSFVVENEVFWHWDAETLNLTAAQHVHQVLPILFCGNWKNEVILLRAGNKHLCLTNTDCSKNKLAQPNPWDDSFCSTDVSVCKTPLGLIVESQCESEASSDPRETHS